MAAVVELSKLVRDNRVLHVCQGKQYVANKQISVSDVYRPGLELTGYFDFYPRKRTQLLGRTEISYAARLDHETRVQVFSKMCTQDTPCFLISRSLPVPEELRIAADQAGIPILSTSESTTYVSSVLTDYLRERLAHRLSVHGVLVEIKGMGILLIGDSGVGKSETALGLINRGHRLIADDRVDVYRRDDETLMGEAPKILRHLMEIRGLGIIDVMELFGVGAVKARTSIQLVINLVNWNGRDNYDRLGVKESKREYCDIAVPEITIPVKVGRNMEDIIEVAAMNFRAKGAGYDAAKTFDANLRALIAANSRKKQKKDQNKNEVGN